VTVDGTLIRTDRCSVAGPTARADRSDRRVDLWWSGKHAAHGGNVQVVCDPAGIPVAVSDVQPASMQDLAAARTAGFLGVLHAAATLLGLPAPADKGYDGAGIGIHTPAKGGNLPPSTATRNQLLTRLRAERRARYRPAQDPVESVTAQPPMSSAHRCDCRRGPRPDQRRATNPLRTPQCGQQAA